MTTYKVFSQDDKIKISVKGHSKASIVNGVDMCCLGVSMLCYTLKDYLDSLLLDGYKSKIKSGLCEIEFLKNSKRISKALCAVDTISHGFRLLKETYPSNITFK